MIKPSTLKDVRPWSSPLPFGRMEYEVVAQNIMKILAENGDTFRELTWEEYEEVRLRHENSLGDHGKPGFVGFEKPYFEKVKFLALGDRDKLRYFSPDWEEVVVNSWSLPKQ